MDRMIECPFCRGRTVIPCGRCANSRRIPDRRAPTANDRALQHLLNKVNAVTAPHRHGQSVSKRRLDDLANAQLKYEESIREEAERG